MTRTGWRGVAAYAAPRKNSSSATPVTAVITTSNGIDALVGEGDHVADLAGEERDLAHDEATDDEDPGQAEAQQDRGDDGSDVVVAAGDPAEVERTGGEGARGPHAGEGERPGVEPGAARLQAQAQPEHDAAEHDHDPGHPLPAAQHLGGVAVVAWDLRHQRVPQPASA